MAGRASIVGAAATHVGKVREHNEDAHFLDQDLGLFMVCDGMGGHAAGEVASAIAIQAIRQEWASTALHGVVEYWLERGTPEAKRQLLEVIRAGVLAAHAAILAEAERDESKSGMGTTLVGAIVVGGDLVFAHAGDSRAYLVRDGISMQLTEDHTLLARLLAAGIDVDVSGEGARFRSMLTNALGIGDECKVSSFVVPLADGDRFLLCSDGISEYVPENEVGEVLTKQPTPARAAQRLIDLALERGGGDNATAVVMRVLEAGETPHPAEQRKKDDAAVASCALWGSRITPQRRLRALRIAIPRDHSAGAKLPARALGDRVAWIIVEGELVQDGASLGPGALVYPESLVNVGESPPETARDAFAITRSDVRALAIRADDFRELCEDDGELGEALLEGLAQVMAKRKLRSMMRDPGPPVDPRGHTDPHLPMFPSDDFGEGRRPSDSDLQRFDEVTQRERAATVPDEEPTLLRSRIPVRPQQKAESPIIAPAPPRSSPSQPLPQPGAAPAQPSKRVSPPLPAAPSRPSLVPAPMSARPASRPPGRLTPPPDPAPGHPGAPPPPRARQPSAPPPVRPTPAQANAAAALPHTSSSPRSSRTSRASTPPAAASSPLDAVSARPDSSRSGHVVARSAMKGFAPALTPPQGTPTDNPVTPLPLEAALGGARGAIAPGDKQLRPPTDPEIETYLEIEAELPPEAGGDAEPPFEVARDLARDLAPQGRDLDGDHESMSITIEEDSTRVIETVTETDSHTITLTVTEPVAAEPAQPRASTGQDKAAAARPNGGTNGGTNDDGPGQPRRARRHSEGYED